jgi:hypothetical protein
MNKDVVLLGLSILVAALALWILAVDSDTAVKIKAGCTLFVAGWIACYRSDKYLNRDES